MTEVEIKALLDKFAEIVNADLLQDADAVDPTCDTLVRTGFTSMPG